MTENQHDRIAHRGTKGSNPLSSSGESGANLTSSSWDLRAEALRRGITVFIQTPRLRGGFKKLDPRRISPDMMDEAANLSHGDRPSAEVALVEMPQLDGIVCGGSVAVTRDGRRCGKGEGYRGPSPDPWPTSDGTN